MAKKMKLNLEELKVQSFVTSIDENQKDGIRAGGIVIKPTTVHLCPQVTQGGTLCMCA